MSDAALLDCGSIVVPEVFRGDSDVLEKEPGGVPVQGVKDVEIDVGHLQAGGTPSVVAQRRRWRVAAKRQ